MDDDVSDSSEQQPEPLHGNSPFAPLQSASSSPGLFAAIFVGPHGLRAGWRIFLYLGMAVFIFSLLSAFVPLVSGHGVGSPWRDMFYEVVMAISALVPGLVMARIENRPFAAYGLPVRNAFGKLFWMGTVWGIVSLSFLMLLLRGIGVFTFGHLALHGERIARFAAFWGVYFLLVGFFEEFAARGYLQFTLGNSIGFWSSALLLSLLFGAGHMFNPGEVWIGELGAMTIGLFFCLTLRRTGSLWFAIGMHASWDWGESYLYSVPDSGGMVKGHLLNSSFHGPRWLTGGSVGPEGSVLVFVVIALMWVVFDRMYPSTTDGGRASA
jgi:CAAX protease family protein